MRSRIRLKVCCIESVAEARLAAASGADALGLVSAMPSGPGVIEDGAIAEIAASVPPPAEPVLLTSKVSPDEIAAQAEAAGIRTLQLVRHLPLDALLELRRLDRRLRLWQVIHVEGPDAVGLARSYQGAAHALLLDSGRPSADVAELGGTGRPHDWSVSRAVIAAVQIPVFLAGGIQPSNVTQAIDEAKPWGIDLCSGVRSNGKLDKKKLAALTRSMWG